LFLAAEEPLIPWLVGRCRTRPRTAPSSAPVGFTGSGKKKETGKETEKEKTKRGTEQGAPEGLGSSERLDLGAGNAPGAEGRTDASDARCDSQTRLPPCGWLSLVVAVLLAATRALIVVLPSIAFQLYGFRSFCVAATADDWWRSRPGRPQWCDDGVPSIYAHVQVGGW